ncbi:MAG: FtsQ-type POTRA domain-containing protein [Candidatus Cloacimonetes bacterium]|nr:FtsQ-type POTRA domain-containing protein [Candidatus Cloacimonadota bacterium]MBS3766643.1 FtsQ-type POTRA domain-containing protein [Candidatus Cloacimonadota bacterium]
MSANYNPRNRRNKKKRILPWILTLLLFLTFTSLSAYFMKYGLLRWNIARLQEVEVRGAEYINANRLKFEVEKYLGENIFSLQNSSIQKVAREFPGINTLQVNRIFPDKIRLIVHECKPIAYVESSHNRYFLIDDRGKVLEEKSDASEYPYPVFTKLGLQNLTLGENIDKNSLKNIIDVYEIIEKKYPELLKNIKEFYFTKDGVVLTENERGIRFIVGKKDFPARVEKLDFAYSNFSINSFSEIDLRFSDIKNELIILR